MYTASDLRKGIKIKFEGDPYVVTDFEFSKPGKGQALYRCRLRNMITGNAFDRTFRSNDKFDPPPWKNGTCSSSTPRAMNTTSWTTRATSRS